MSRRPPERAPQTTKVPRYSAFQPATAQASAAARGASRKRDTRCELLLRRELWHRGLRYRLAVGTLPGRPDVVFSRQRVVIFIDGDFWHGRDLDVRLGKLAAGHNASYWVQKIKRNVERDRRHDEELRAAGWTVIRLWEKDILRDPGVAAQRVVDVLR